MTHLELASILIVAAIAINVPFGAYRSTTGRFSWRWFLAVHLPIPVLFVLRFEAGFSYWFIPFMLASAITGQLLGSWSYGLWRERRAVVQARVPDA